MQFFLELLYLPFAILFGATHLGVAVVETTVTYPMSFLSNDRQAADIEHAVSSRWAHVEIDLPLSDKSVFWSAGNRPNAAGGVDSSVIDIGIKN